jgi:catechol 2,3-dioxygenase-like lactoylglutathione lyase family enzyme
MSAKIRHIAIVSDRYALEGRFYEAVFGMKAAADTRPERAVTVSDGAVGLNINPRKAGRPAGLDHFGVEVEDVEATCARLRERYPAIEVLKRPGTRPFAGISSHDPAGNLFDLSQQNMENRTSVYVEPPREQARAISHLALRTLHADVVAEFYADLFGFERLEKKAGDPNHYLSDGRVTLILMPWSILDYEGGGIARPGPDHIGFRVESLEAVKERLQTVGDNNPHLRPFPLGAGPEGQARLLRRPSSRRPRRRAAGYRREIIPRWPGRISSRWKGCASAPSRKERGRRSCCCTERRSAPRRTSGRAISPILRRTACA